MALAILTRHTRHPPLALCTRFLHSYAHGTSKTPIIFERVNDTLRRAVEATPDKEFVVFNQQNIRKTFADVYVESRQLAEGLLALGLRPGDRVGMWGHNYYEWIQTMFATAMAGMIQVNVNPSYQSEELRFALQKSEVRALITPPSHRTNDYMMSLHEVIPEMAAGTKGKGPVNARDLAIEHVIVFNNEEQLPGCWDFKDIFKSGGSEQKRQLEENEKLIRSDDPVNIQYTSGTTGSPKAATLTHCNIINNGYFIGRRSGWDKQEHRACIPNPLYHCFGIVIGVMNALVHRQTCIFPSASFHVEEVLKSIHEEKCTFLFGTPTMFIDILASPEINDFDLSSLRGGYIAGAPCPRALCENMISKLNMKDIYVLYGSTELSPVVTMSTSDQEPLDRINSVGSVMPHTEVVVVDKKGCVLPRGQKGEILARGYSVMLGYWGDEEKTKQEVTPDRWYHTGDTASMNEDGNVQIVGRSKDMIIRGGENIYPTEIEQFFHKQEFVADAQVVGVPDDRMGEAVCVWIRLKPKFMGKITEEHVKEVCKGKLAHYKVPKYVLIKEERDFPLTATGKVKKFELRLMSKQMLGLVGVKSHFNSKRV